MQQTSTRTPATRHQVTALKTKLCCVETVCALLHMQWKLSANGRSATVRCPHPNHLDRTPSCAVFVGRDHFVHFRCHACGAHGDVLELIALVRGVDPKTDFKRLLLLAADMASVAVERPSDVIPMGLSDIQFHEFAAALLDLAPVAREDEAMGYLAARGLDQLAVEDGWGALPADPHRQQRLAIELRRHVGDIAWSASGMTKGAGFTAPSHSIIIPWRTPTGAIDTVQRRTIGGKSYLDTRGRPHRFPYGIERIVGEPYVFIFVEGAIDVLAYRALHRLTDAHSVLGLPGADAWLDEWDTLVMGRHVVVALDADRRGHDAADALALRLGSVAATVERQVPRANDWADELQWRRR